MSTSITFDPMDLRNKFDAGPEAFDTFFSIFKKNYPERIGKLENCITQNHDFDQMYGVAHTIKGSVSYFYLNDLTQICVKMEDVIRTRDLVKIKEHFSVYKENLDYFLKEVTAGLETL
ncbi:MAG: hypothetical protein A2381_19110 [Bdellovibrionales bacterium RIFOXYB1_FULL_37_110]|nr:MAG: hypothetical protein A2181_09380 [Bdellovibrionales bacterium RIFOXYA1_FULL_38_20]OFZ49489.1 MAG: hypothetical protein A2417_04260 [Bdellovibrionales bacterium RIFOXYC1_FULL_37_79]OFZ58643.1 MAG: hypothetical protein A2381_19110 [Bdellovibrionales bacterium RIFOXYB1_FULL_37_110]OFZ63384.1 MAG: hypothetical protein A2577_17370 [Bdellovibrionales bacterium RIFOXYD1_FULL_36_51]